MATPETTTDRLSEIKARAEKATPGPWEPLTEYCDCGSEYNPCGHGPYIYAIRLPAARIGRGDGKYGEHDYVNSELSDFTPETAEFLLRARDDVPWLVSALEQASAEIADLRHALSVAERHDADVRLDVEHEIRDEAAKVGA